MKIEPICEATPQPKWYCSRPERCWYEATMRWRGNQLCGKHYRMARDRVAKGQPVDEIKTLMGLRP